MRIPGRIRGGNKIGSGQVPIGDVVDALITKDSNDTQKTYGDFVEVVKATSLLPCLGLSNAHRKVRPILSLLLATRHLPWLLVFASALR